MPSGSESVPMTIRNRRPFCLFHARGGTTWLTPDVGGDRRLFRSYSQNRRSGTSAPKKESAPATISCLGWGRNQGRYQHCRGRRRLG